MTLRRPRLTIAELGLMMRAWPRVAGVRAALWLRPAQTVASASRVRGPATIDPAQRVVAARVARSVERAARLVPNATCLTQAIATRRMLAARGIPSSLELGVARDHVGDVIAHAWLELGGEVVIGDSPTAYARLSSGSDVASVQATHPPAERG